MAHSIGVIGTPHDQFKIRWADKMARGLSAYAILQDKFPFREAEKTGESFVMPVLTKRVSGGTRAAAQAGAVTFNDIRTSVIEKATLKGSQYWNWNGCDEEAALASMGEQKAWTPEFDLAMRDLYDTGSFHLELALLWGQFPLGSIGQLDANPIANVFVLTPESTAPGILYNLVGHELEVFSLDLTTKRTGTHVVTAVDPEAGTITVTDDGNVVDTDVIFLKDEVVEGAPATHKTGAGLAVWATPATTLAGLSTATRPTWKPTEIDAAGESLSFDMLIQAAKNVQNRGFAGKLCALVSPDGWTDAMNDMSATVRRQAGDRKYVLGAEAISFYTGTGEIEVISDPYQKKGYAHVFPVAQKPLSEYEDAELDNLPCRRIGASDLVFVGPDGKTSKAFRESYFYKLQGTNVIVAEVYSHQALFVGYRSRLVTISGITNSVDAA